MLRVRLGVSIWAQMGPIGPKRAQTAPIGHFGHLPEMPKTVILGKCPKCPIGPIWACLGPIGPIWAQMDIPNSTLNTRHPTSANCGDGQPETGLKSPRLRVPRLAALNWWCAEGSLWSAVRRHTGSGQPRAGSATACVGTRVFGA